MLGVLERFSGYTLTTLMKEDAELVQLLAIEERGTPERRPHPE